MLSTSLVFVMKFYCLPEYLVDFRQRGQSLQQFVKLRLSQLLCLRPEVEYRAANVAELVGTLLGRALADVFLPLLQPLELVGDLLPLGLILLPLREELFFCFHLRFPPMQNDRRPDQTGQRSSILLMG